MPAVLLYSSPLEPITRALLKYSFRKKCDEFFPVSLSNFLDNVEVFDKCTCYRVTINWWISENTEITNDKNHFLINRVVNIPEKIFLEFDPSDISYARAELHAYLRFAISSFPSVSEKTSPFGLCGNRYPLPHQWSIIKKSNINVEVPNFYIGSLSFCDLKNQDMIVYSSTDNFYNWRPGNNLTKTNCNFCFERPKGNPIIYFKIGRVNRVFSYFDSQKLSKEQKRVVTSIGTAISAIFDYFVSEILFFIEKDFISFGMATNIPYASMMRISNFSSLVQNEYGYLYENSK